MKYFLWLVATLILLPIFILLILIREGVEWLLDRLENLMITISYMGSR